MVIFNSFLLLYQRVYYTHIFLSLVQVAQFSTIDDGRLLQDILSRGGSFSIRPLARQDAHRWQIAAAPADAMPMPKIWETPMEKTMEKRWET